MSPVYQPVIQQPAAIDLLQDKEESYRSFVSSWKTFYILTELNKRPNEYQVAMLKHCVGVEAVKIIETSLQYEEDSRKVDNILKILHIYCVGERIREDCTRKKLIAFGNNLTLEEAVKICRSQELAARAMKDISSQALTSDLPTKPVEAVSRSSRRQKPAYVSKPSVGKSGTCGYCGGITHPRSQCPARSDRCKECNKVGHWGKACRSAIFSKRDNLAETESDGPAEETLFCEDLKIDSVHNHPGWSATIEVDKTPVKFKLDSGADASVMKITEPMVQKVNLDQARSRLRGPENHSINCLGTFTACLRYGRKSTNETIYVIANQNTNLLSREAFKNLGLLTCNVYQVETDIETIYQQYPTVFNGLDFVKDYSYEISLKEDTRPMCIYTARFVPQPLLPKVKDKLQKMVKMGVISPVKEATEWCSGMVPVPKPDGSVRICVDLSHLNQSVRREIYQTACVEDSLAKLGQSKVFSHLDANSGYHQINLTKHSRLLTTFLTPSGRYAFNRLPFGISVAPEVFQRYMNELLGDIERVIIHMDDILIHAATREIHDDRFRQEAFARLKEILASDKVLAPYDPKLETVLATDACNSGVGAALFQIQADGTRRPVSFASRSLTEVEGRYAVIEKEALAVAWGCERFNQYLHGLMFTVEVDHKPLVTLLNSRNLADMPARVLRFRLCLMKYSPTVTYITGSKHHVADYLSRTNGAPTTVSEVQFIDEVEYFNKVFIPKHSPVNRIQDAQNDDPILRKVIEFCQRGWPAYKSEHPSLTPYFDHQGHLTVDKEVLLYDGRLVIPGGL
ncbi:uncharacterized protein [Watersipora subatra]|uniref:uncharacterized protein n=1 Tax=Watersipora subatra TaxID=2589382 RepID=UPI00355B2D18